MRRAVIAAGLVVIGMVATVVFRQELRLVKLLAPGMFSMVDIGDGLHVDPTMTVEQRTALRAARQAAAEQLHEVFPEVITAPPIIACATEECFRSFGGGRQRGLAFGDWVILLSPRGLTQPILTHELCHVELHAWLGTWKSLTMIPRWFDEGLAVVVSQEPTHSETVWEDIVHRNLPRPTLAELTSFGDWDRAVRRYGGTQPDAPKVVYATVSHELRRWYAKTGPAGLGQLIAEIQAGQEFDAAYGKVGG